MKKENLKILCVCSDDYERAPAMAAVLTMFLQNHFKPTFVFESAGMNELAKIKGPASPVASVAVFRVGAPSLRDHSRRHISTLTLKDYNTIVAADATVAREVIRSGYSDFDVYNADIPDPWPAHSHASYRRTFVRILESMYDFVQRYD